MLHEFLNYMLIYTNFKNLLNNLCNNIFTLKFYLSLKKPQLQSKSTWELRQMKDQTLY